MKKAKFYKHNKKNYFCLMLENNLFIKDDEFLTKLLETIKLFYKDGMTIICNFFDDNNDEFANELNKAFGDKIETLFTKKKLFSRTEYFKRQVRLNETSLNEVIALAVKHCTSPEIEDSDNQDVVLFELGLNDNDGTFINCNTTIYKLEEIKTKISQILND